MTKFIVKFEKQDIDGNVMQTEQYSLDQSEFEKLKTFLNKYRGMPLHIRSCFERLE
jgi:hypothetical protein